jgi:hypothetical protein
MQADQRRFDTLMHGHPLANAHLSPTGQHRADSKDGLASPIEAE